jgi:hypothetical protein
LDLVMEEFDKTSEKLEVVTEIEETVND